MMLFTVRNSVFGGSSLKNIKIVKNKKYGIVNELDNTYVLPEKYDNIFLYGINVYALYKNGKIGLCKIDNEKVDMLCECEYDVIDNYNHDLFLSNDSKTCYFNSNTQQTMMFDEVVIDTLYIYGCEDDYQYIVKQETGQIIYKKEHTKYSKSYYVYCGETEKGAVFYDATFSMYIYPTDEGYKPYEQPLNHPVIVNKYNIINIIDGENGIEVIDSFGNKTIDDKYKSVKIELKVTAVNDDEKVEKIIEIPDNTFAVDTVSIIENWI